MSHPGFVDSLGSSGVFSRFTGFFFARALGGGRGEVSGPQSPQRPVPAQLQEHVCRRVACGFMLAVSVSALGSYMSQLTGTGQRRVRAAADVENRGGTTARTCLAALSRGQREFYSKRASSFLTFTERCLNVTGHVCVFVWSFWLIAL